MHCFESAEPDKDIMVNMVLIPFPSHAIKGLCLGYEGPTVARTVPELG